MALSRTQTLDWQLPDDTEESVVGTEWHQFAISFLVSTLRTYALDASLPWHVGHQLTLIGPGTSNTPWRPKPDISIHPTAGPAFREELDTRTEGLPALLVEVLSPSTWEYDTSLRPEGKAWGYLEVWRTAEYLVFDPHGTYVAEKCRGWRRQSGRLEPWRAGQNGRYESSLGVSFAADGTFLRAYDPQGQPMPFDFELSMQLREERARLLDEQTRRITAEQQAQAEQAARLAAEQRLAALEDELRRLRGSD